MGYPINNNNNKNDNNNINVNNNSSSVDFKLSLDSKWKFSVGTNGEGAILKKGLPDTPVDDEIKSLVGGWVKLPCDVTPPNPLDHPYLVLLSRGTIPIYSIDARTGQNLGSALHWKATPESGIQDTWFLQDENFSGFMLNGVQEKAEGDYFCRVDFESSPTRNRKIHLEVIVPPSKIKILNEVRDEVQKSVGPYPEGSSLRLECIVYGGKPPPTVTWWHEGSMIDGTVDERRGDSTVNILTLAEITRKNLFSTVACQGNNSNLAPPIKKSLSVDMLFPPKNVKIKDTKDGFLKEGEGSSYTCDSEGSRPPAKITWWKNGFLLNDTKELILHDGNTIRSIVSIVPTIEDDQAILTCRAQNPLLSPTSVVEDARRLLVHYAPRMHLVPGQMMNMSGVTEGDDIYLECLIKAQPKETMVSWYHQGNKLVSNKRGGIIVSHESLVLQKVKKNSSGNYTCEASNPVGTSQSNALLLSVKFVPVCAKNQQFVYGGGNNQLVNVSCTVEAYPHPIGFKWAFNTSAEHIDIPKNLVQSEGLTSVVSYTPLTHLDFGSLLCWSFNEIGEQNVPCVFQVVPASPPETPTNCSVWHEAGTAGEVVVACRPGWDGGLPQNFSLEVKVKGSDDILAALRGQPIPHFTVTGLAPGTEYILVVIASNSQGNAPPARITHLTPIDIAEKRLSATAAEGDQETKNISSLVAILSGVFGAIFLCFILLVVIVKIRLNKRRTARYEDASEQQLEEVQIQSQNEDQQQMSTDLGKAKPCDASLKKKLSIEKLKRKQSGAKEELITQPSTVLDIHSPSCSNLVSESSPLVAPSSISSKHSQHILSLTPSPIVPSQMPLSVPQSTPFVCSKNIIPPDPTTSLESNILSTLRHQYPPRHFGGSPTTSSGLTINRQRGGFENLRGLSRDNS